jgi:hypothetical protein
MESKDYERHSETITIPPAHVSPRCDKGYARASIIANKSGSEPQLECTL